MKKQVLALSCALALAFGSNAALSPATGPAAEPTAQIGYGVAKYYGATGAAKAATEGTITAVGGGIGHIFGSSTYTVTQLPRVSARVGVSIGMNIGARVGIFGGLAGLAIGAAVGAL